MTREEAIKVLENGGWWDSLDDDISDADMNPLQEALDLALTALRGPTREMLERMRGEWISTGSISCKCSRCGHAELKTRATEYSCCPRCMAPMTAEAVDMMLERWKEALHEIPPAT